MKQRNFAQMLVLSVVFFIQSLGISLPHACCGACNAKLPSQISQGNHCQHAVPKIESCCSAKKLTSHKTSDFSSVETDSPKGKSKCKCTISSGNDLPSTLEQPFMVSVNDLAVANLYHASIALPLIEWAEKSPKIEFTDSSPPSIAYEQYSGRAPPCIS